MNSVIAKRLEILELTRAKYFDFDFRTLPTRSVNNGACMYRSEKNGIVKHCAIGQLDTNFIWHEGPAIGDRIATVNEEHVIFLAKRDGWYDNDRLTLQFAHDLQKFHDADNEISEKRYNNLKSFLFDSGITIKNSGNYTRKK